jgi:hypothetical protein
VSEVLHPLFNIEREVMRESGLRVSADLPTLLADELDASARLAKASLELSAHLTRTAIEEETEAAYELRIESELLIAKLDEMREGL